MKPWKKPTLSKGHNLSHKFFILVLIASLVALFISTLVYYRHGYRTGINRIQQNVQFINENPTEMVAELDQNFKKLDAEHIDLTVAIDLTGRNIIKKLFPDSANNFSIVKKPILSIMTSMAFPKGQNGPLQSFRKGLDIILANGTFYEIIERYYGKDYSFEDILPQDIHGKMKKNY